MKKMIQVLLMLGVAATAFAESPQNPPPSTAFAGYDKYELLPIAMGPPYAGDKGKEAAKDKIQAYMNTETNPIIEQWNKDAAEGARGQSLVIEPRIEKLKVVSGSARFWAAAMSGAWTFGGQDKDMLHRIVALANLYLQSNYQEAVGGATGYDAD